MIARALLIAWAAASALLPCMATAQSDPTAPELGRLFYSPERRAQLDRQRLLNIRQTQAIEGSLLTLDGVVKRSSGKSTVWINHRPQTESDSTRTGIAAVPNAKNPANVRLTPGEDTGVDLRVGEAINRGTGERSDRLGGGTIVVPARR